MHLARVGLLALATFAAGPAQVPAGRPIDAAGSTLTISLFGGTVKVKDELKVAFDILPR